MTEDLPTSAKREAASHAATLANMLELLNAAYGRRRLFSGISSPNPTIRRLRRLAKSSNVSPRSYRLVTRGFGKMEKYIAEIHRSVNRARDTASSGVLASISDTTITTMDVESAGQALAERIKRLHKEIQACFTIISGEEVTAAVSPALESLFNLLSPETDE